MEAALLFWRRYPEVVAAILCFILLFLLNRRHGKVPTNWPVLGMLPAILSNISRIHDFATDVLHDADCTIRIKGPWFSRMDFLVTCDPANINHIFNSNFANYPKGDEFSEIFAILGGGIFNADQESWKAQRRMTHGLIAEKGFRRYVVETSYDKVRRGVVPLLRRAAEEGLTVDLQDVFLRFTFDVTSILVMAVDPGCLTPGMPVVPYAKAMDDAEEVLLYRHAVPTQWWKLMRRLGIGPERRMTAAWETIDRFIAKHVSAKKVDRTLVAAQRPSPDLLSSYLYGKAAEEKNNGTLDTTSDSFLRDTVVNLMLAGRDTTAAGLSWFFLLLSKNPDVESKILAELRANCKNVDGPLDAQALSSLVYLHAALSETLRLYPPVPFEHKSVVQTEVLPTGHEVGPDTKIVVSLYAMARMEGVWGDDCQEFKPERWIADSGKIRHEPSYKFMSFNSGPRTCLGKDIAFTQMKAVVATVLSSFELDVEDGLSVLPKTSIILHMKHGLKVRVKKREMLFS